MSCAAGLRLHATCVCLEGSGILLRGPSGAGKSDLALRLMELGADLVADDQVELTCAPDGSLLAAPPPPLAGWLEVRGLGLLSFPWRAPVPLRLAIDLVHPDRVDRLPAPRQITLLGCSVPLFSLCPWEVSAALKVRLAGRLANGAIMQLL